MSISAALTAKRDPEIQIALNRLSCAIDCADKATQCISNRLETILAPAMPQENPDALVKAVQKPLPPLAERLTTMAAQLERVVEGINNLEIRVEL